jgi:hypothetical protein
MAITTTATSTGRASGAAATTPYLTSPKQLAATNLVQDAAAILTPDTDIGGTGSRFTLLSGGNNGTYLVPCLKSAVADANGSAVVIVAFGRDSDTDPWEPLYTADNAGKSATLTTATASDVKDATYRYTYGAPTKWFNRAGYRQVLFGVTTAYNGASVATAQLLVREI